MKLTLFLLTAALMQVSARSAGQAVTYSGNNVKLQEVFAAVERQTGFLFFYDGALIKNARAVTVSAEGQPLESFLKDVLWDQSLDFSIRNHTILVYRKNPQPLEMRRLQAKGRVLDEKGQPLRGASVRVKGAKNGVTTDAEGNFQLDVSTGDEIEITFIGYITLRFRLTANGAELVGGQPGSVTGSAGGWMIKLAAAETALNEVVVNKGYYQESKRLSTGNVSTVSGKDISRQPVTNPLQALQGRMPGVYVQQTSGMPGAAINIQIRGRNSIAAGNEPLYIVDGVPFAATSLQTGVGGTVVAGVSPFNSINPADIAQVEVLKDADATAIYGSRGANGVVLITTRKGTAGKSRVEINVNESFGRVTRYLELLNTEQYLEMRREAFANDGLTPGAGDYDVNGKWDQNRYTNWQKLLTGGTRRQTNATASVSGGTMNTRFLVSGSYWRETTVFPYDFSYQRGSMNFNLDHTSENKKFRMMFSGIFSADRNHLPGEDPIYIVGRLAPNAPAVYKEDGTLNWENNTFDNPLKILKQKYVSRTDCLVSNMDLGYEILPNLKLRTVLGFTSLRMKDMQLSPISSQNPAYQPTGSSNFGNGNERTWSVEPQLTYKADISEGSLDMLVGATLQQTIRDQIWFIGMSYTSDALLENYMAAPYQMVVMNPYSQYRYQAVFGRVNYNWRDKYLVNFTARHDGSSRFGPGKQYALFASAGGAWLFSNEPFVADNLHFLSFGKLRASYGSTGNDRIGDYEYLNTYTAVSPYMGTSIVPKRIANPDYGWEVNRKFEAALMLGFIKDRILLEASWYKNRSSNQLVGLSLPATAGFTDYRANFPATVQNTGWEFELNTVNTKSQSLTWSSSFNITFPRNKLVAYPGIETSTYRNRFEVGQPLNKPKLWLGTGVDPATGVYQFADVDGDGMKFGDADKKAVKRIGQNYYGGLRNTFQYRSLELAVFLQFVKQTAQSYKGQAAFASSPGTRVNQPVDVMRRWQKPGDITDIQRFTATHVSDAAVANRYLSGSTLGPSSATVVDASFIRLQNVSLAWQLKRSWLSRTPLNECSLMLQAQNLLTITNYLGYDPENATTDRLPPLRVISAGIRITL